MALGFSSSIVNIGAFFIYFFIVIHIYQTNYITKNIKNFIYFLGFIVVLISIYALLSPSQLDKKSLEYLIKAYLFLFTGILVIYSFSLKDFNFLVNFVIIFSIVLTIMKMLNLIDYEKTHTNYLIYALLLGLSIVFLFYDILFKNISMLKKVIYSILIFYFIVMNLFTGSRGALLFALILMLLMFLKKITYLSLPKIILYTTIMIVILYYSFIYIIDNIEIHSWLLHKIERMLNGNISEEPRYELYSNVFKYLEENINIFGFGFHASRNISTSWDNSLPYLESFPLELVFNYGIFGLSIVLYQTIFILYFFKKNIYKYPLTLKSLMMFLFVLFNFSKGWSVYNGFVVFPLMSIVLIIYLQEKELKYEN